MVRVELLVESSPRTEIIEGIEHATWQNKQDLESDPSSTAKPKKAGSLHHTSPSVSHKKYRQLATRAPTHIHKKTPKQSKTPSWRFPLCSAISLSLLNTPLHSTHSLSLSHLKQILPRDLRSIFPVILPRKFI